MMIPRLELTYLVMTMGVIFVMSEDINAQETIDARLYKRSINNNNNNNNNNNVNTNVNINYNWVTVSRVTTVSSTTMQCSTPDGHTMAFAMTAVGSDGCTQSTCTATGLFTSSASCPNHVPTQNDFHQCSYGGVIHKIWGIFPHADGCNQCVCALTSVQCTDADACKPKADCTQNGVGYSSGQSFPHPDGCNLCQCTILGVICTSNTCTTTTTAAPFTCEWFGKFYHDGDVMQGDGCHTCTCNQGQAVCSASMNCPVNP